MRLNRLIGLTLLIVSAPVQFALADGSSIDKIYHPYVEPLEWEVEWRMLHQNKDPQTGEKRAQLQKIGVGKAVAEHVFVEVYTIAEQSADESLNVEAYELEVLWQLTEQGEYNLDYALLFELEKVEDNDAWEYATQLLLEKELGNFSATANLGVVYEWGEAIADEWETAAAFQLRYRQAPAFEPAVEFFAGENTRAFGPAATGLIRLAPNKALRWEVGAAFGLNSDTADYTLRTVLEYEF